jgi:hypothetical protein
MSRMPVCGETLSRQQHAGAGHLDLKIRERRAAMWGYDSSQRFDLVAMTEAKQPSNHEKIKAAILGLIEQAPPAQKALRRRLEELSPEAALELLGLPKPQDGGKATIVPPSDGEPDR